MAGVSIGQPYPAPDHILQRKAEQQAGCGSGCGDGSGSVRPQYRRSAAIDGNQLFFTPRGASDDETLTHERKPLHSRAADMVRNDPQAAGAAASQATAMVGHRFLLDCELYAKGFGIPVDRAEAAAEEIEDRFDIVAESDRYWLDAGQQRTFSGMAFQVPWNCFVYGEHFSVMRETRDQVGRPTPVTILGIDPQRISNPPRPSRNANIYHGIERTRETGAPVAYWIERNTHFDPTVRRTNTRQESHFRLRRIDSATGAWMVIHAGDFTRHANSTRPVPPLATVMHLLRRTGQYNDAVLDAAYKSALMGIAITSDVPHAIQDIFAAGQPAAGQMPWDGYQKSIFEYLTAYGAAGASVMEGADPYILPVGSKIEMLQPGQPTDSAEPFNVVLDRLKASGLEDSYERFSGDYSKTNFHGAMMGDMKAAQQRRVKAAQMPERWGKMVVYNWLMHELVANKIEALRGIVPVGLDASGFPRAINWYRNNSDNFKFSFLPPGRIWANPKVMYDAYQTGIEAGLTSHKRSINEMHGERERTIIKQNVRHERLQATLRDELAPADGSSAAQDVNTGPDFDALKRSAEAYGVAVRSGRLTPQTDDEAQFRADMALPALSPAAQEAWQEDEGVRRPITLRQKEEPIPANIPIEE